LPRPNFNFLMGKKINHPNSYITGEGDCLKGVF
jgi:hypothetical protein